MMNKMTYSDSEEDRSPLFFFSFIFPFCSLRGMKIALIEQFENAWVESLGGGGGDKKLSYKLQLSSSYVTFYLTWNWCLLPTNSNLMSDGIMV